MIEVIFLICLALVWIGFASVQDLKNREVANWLSFSLIIFALGFRFFYCLFDSGNFAFFYQGLIGLGIFFILGNLLYYGRMFAGGDAKLMIALGAVLPFSENFFTNLNIFVLFFFVFLFSGAVYGLVISTGLCLRNFKKFKNEFFRLFKKNKKLFYAPMIFGLILMACGFVKILFFIF
ncbi:MAG: prepilin peptidase, partial [Nanoarchaeota archaeon]